MLTPCLFTLRFLCLNNTLYSRPYQLVKSLLTKKHAVTKSPTTDLRCRSPVPYQLCTGLLWSMAVWIDTGVHRALVSKKLRLLEIFKYKLGHARRRSYHVEQV